ncbi:unnamed protein product [Dicrocoelium dendriticum]|nr:unnamed protein product [Dicrocoelium dendriticum]
MSSRKTKRPDVHEDSADSLSDLEDSPPKKKPSSDTKHTKAQTSANHTVNADGDKMIDLTGKKFVCVRQFKGRTFVDIREYYEDKSSGDLKPGKKGISLNVEQWDNLKQVVDEIDKEIVNSHR